MSKLVVSLLLERVKTLKTRQIKLSSIEEVKDFVTITSKCKFDIDIFYNRVIIDAKSILGILGLDLSKILTVKYAGVDSDFERILENYESA